MSLELLVPPPVEPVALAALKSRLRLSNGDFDQRLSHLITAARMRVEQETGLALIEQTWLERRDRWAGDGRLTAFASRFRLLKPPLLAVERITLLDENDQAQIWDAALYRIDTACETGRIILRDGSHFPEPGRSSGGIEIRYQAGYGPSAEDVPAPIAIAIELLAASLFENGGQQELPPRVTSLLAPWRRLSL